MTKVVLPNGEFSDDGTATRDMRNYGYMEHLLPLAQGQLMVAAQVVADKLASAGTAGAAAGSAENAAGYAQAALEKAAQTVMDRIATGQDRVATGQDRTAVADMLESLEGGPLLSVNGKTGPNATLTATDIAPAATPAEMAAGTVTDYRSMSPAHVAGAIGALAGLKRVETAVALTLLATHRGTMVDVTAGVTITLSAAATLGGGWYVYVRNRSGNAVAIVQAAGEKTTLLPAQATLLQCDGTTISLQGQGFDVGSLGTLSAGTAIGSNVAGSTFNSNILVLGDDTIIKAFVDYATGSVSFRRGVLTGGVFVFGPALVVTTGVTNSQWGIDLFKISATKAVAFYYSGSSTWVVVVESSSTNSLVLRSNSGSSDNGTAGLRNGVFQLSISRYVLVGVNSSTNTVAAVYSLNLTTDAAALINTQTYTGAGNQNVPGLVFKISGTEIGVFSVASNILYKLTFNLTTGVAVVSSSRNQTSAGRKLASVVQISIDRFFTSAVADTFSSSSSIYGRSTTGIRSTTGGNFFRAGRAAGDAMPAMRAVALSETKASFVGVVHNPNYDAPSILFGPVESPADFSVAATLPLSSGSALSGDGVDVVALSNGNYAVSYYSADQHLVAYLTRGTLL